MSPKKEERYIVLSSADSVLSCGWSPETATANKDEKQQSSPKCWYEHENVHSFTLSTNQYLESCTGTLPLHSASPQCLSLLSHAYDNSSRPVHNCVNLVELPFGRAVNTCVRKINCVIQISHTFCVVILNAVRSGFLSPQDGASSGCGWRNSL